MTKLSKIIAAGFGATMLVAACPAFAATPHYLDSSESQLSDTGVQEIAMPGSRYGNAGDYGQGYSGNGPASRFGTGQETHGGNGPASRFGSAQDDAAQDPYENTLEVNEGDKPAGRYGYSDASARATPSAAGYNGGNSNSQGGQNGYNSQGNSGGYGGQNSYNSQGNSGGNHGYNGQGGYGGQYNNQYGGGYGYNGYNGYNGHGEGCPLENGNTQAEGDTETEDYAYNEENGGDHGYDQGSRFIEETSESLIFEIADKTDCETENCTGLTLRDANGNEIYVGLIEFAQELIDDASLEELIYHLAQNGSAVRGQLQLGEADDEGNRLYMLHIDQIYS